jgi:hypothetical protein
VFGYDCVNASGGHIEGSAGPDLEAYVRLRTDLRNTIPIAAKLGKANEVGLFTLIEWFREEASEHLTRARPVAELVRDARIPIVERYVTRIPGKLCSGASSDPSSGSRSKTGP